MQATPTAVGKSARQRQQAHHERVQPDQGIKDEVGAQMAQQAIFPLRNGVWGLPRPHSRRDLRTQTFRIPASHLLDR